MDKIHNWINTVLIIALFVVVVLVGNNQSAPKAGGITNYDAVTIRPVDSGDGLKVTDGTYGSTYTLISTGTCTLLSNFSITASTTRSVDCVIPESVSGDRIILTLEASTTMASQYVIKSSQASSTSGYASAQLINLTGQNAVPSATSGFGSSTLYQLFRKL